MSIMNSAEAARLALDEAAQHLNNVIVIYVEPDRTAKPLSFTKRLTLPETDDVQLPFALGCARAGALPVLDLHALENASERFAAALRAIGADRVPPMVVRVSDRHPAAMTGARVLAPKNPRELAGALRYALRSGEICVVAENPLGAYESCEVPDDWDELYGDAPYEEAVLYGESSVRDEQAADFEAIDVEEAEAAEESLHDDEAASSYVEEAEPAAADAPSSAEEPPRTEEAKPAAADAPSSAEKPPRTEEAKPAAADAPSSAEEPLRAEEAEPAAINAPFSAEESAQTMNSVSVDSPEAQGAPVELAEERQALSDAEPVEASAGEAAMESSEAPARPVMPAFRTRRYDPAELERTARLLNVPREMLMRLCCRRAENLAEIVIEADAEAGETACLPPREKAACLWVGADMLSICWDPARLDGDAARALLKDAAANLTLPARLILDKEK